MKRIFLLTALAASGLFTAAAQAADLDYTYAEGGYTTIDSDGFDADGWSLGGSFAITPNVHMLGSYSKADLDNSAGEADVWRLGVGWNTSVTDNSDLVVRANYASIGYDFPAFPLLLLPAFSVDADGWEAEVGLRSALAENFESYVALGYADVNGVSEYIDGNSSLYGKLGAQYKFNPTWGVAASVTLSDETNQWFVGPRINF